MKSQAAKNGARGRRAERDFCKVLKLAGFNYKRGIDTAKGDVIPEASCKRALWLHNLVHFEVKMVVRSRFSATWANNIFQKQCKVDAKKYDKIPILVYKMDRQPWMLYKYSQIIPDLLTIYPAWEYLTHVNELDIVL